MSAAVAKPIVEEPTSTISQSMSDDLDLDAYSKSGASSETSSTISESTTEHGDLESQMGDLIGGANAAKAGGVLGKILIISAIAIVVVVCAGIGYKIWNDCQPASNEQENPNKLNLSQGQADPGELDELAKEVAQRAVESAEAKAAAEELVEDAIAKAYRELADTEGVKTKSPKKVSIVEPAKGKAARAANKEQEPVVDVSTHAKPPPPAGPPPPPRARAADGKPTQQRAGAGALEPIASEEDVILAAAGSVVAQVVDNAAEQASAGAGAD